MQWPSEFLLNVSISGVTGAMLSFSIERFLKYKSRSLKNKELFKTWYSTWQPCFVEDQDWEWVEETITLGNTWRWSYSTYKLIQQLVNISLPRITDLSIRIEYTHES